MHDTKESLGVNCCVREEIQHKCHRGLDAKLTLMLGFESGSRSRVELRVASGYTALG